MVGFAAGLQFLGAPNPSATSWWLTPMPNAVLAPVNYAFDEIGNPALTPGAGSLIVVPFL